MADIKQISDIIETLYGFQLAKYNIVNRFRNEYRELYLKLGLPEMIVDDLASMISGELEDKLECILGPAIYELEKAVVACLVEVGFSINIANAIVYNGTRWKKHIKYFEIKKGI